ncbi:MAG TPA: site-2 protease family protein [Candidatus Thermoplasmatota archaeon]|nr:site-2 protease family protein [Candidatus Thermoplasmatota archaeon]
MASFDGLLLFLAALNLYLVVLLVLRFRGKLSGPNFELALGACILWRTEKGLRLMDRLARAKSFWRVAGDVGVVATIVAGAGIFALLLFQLWIFATNPVVASRAAVPPEQLLVLPGLNPLIPLWYGILALAVALIVHEYSHGILARAHDLKVKSMGLIFFIVPIGAFVEPDDEEMERAPTRVKNRVFAAGVTSNLVVALLCALVFTSAWGALAVKSEGVGVSVVYPGSPAEEAGLRSGSVLTHVDARPVANTIEFSRRLEGKNVYDTIGLRILQPDGRVVEREVHLVDRYGYFAAHFPQANNQSYFGRPWLGVGTLNLTSQGGYPVVCDRCPPPSMQDLIQLQTQPLAGGWNSFGFFIGLPFAGLSPFPDDLATFYAVKDGPFSALGVGGTLVLANAMYWIFWLNLMVGTFNALPAGPLDGGQMYRTSVRGILRRILGVPGDRIVVERLDDRSLRVRGLDAQTQEKLDRVERTARRITWTTGLLILGLILVPLLLPHLAR